MIPLPVYLFVLIELLAVSYGDIKTKKIPNFWSILNLFVFIVLLFVAPHHYSFEWQTFIFSIAFLVVGFALFLLKIMGGGDTKFLFTFFLLLPISMQEETFYYLLLSTLIIGGVFFLYNTLKNFGVIWESFRVGNIQAVKSCYGTKFSFAPVILVAWVWVGWTLKDTF